jgi:hypothetical protein
VEALGILLGDSRFSFVVVILHRFVAAVRGEVLLEGWLVCRSWVCVEVPPAGVTLPRAEDNVVSKVGADV